MKHFSLDLETLSTKPTAAILSIGVYDLNIVEAEQPDEDRMFYMNVSLDSCLTNGLSIDESTFRWWLGQSDDARAALFEPNPVTLEVLGDSLGKWFRSRLNGPYRVWAHATFDFPILDNALRSVGSTTPWHFTSLRDLRTVFDGKKLHDYKNSAPQNHHAGWDAFNQGRRLLDAFRLM